MNHHSCCKDCGSGMFNGLQERGVVDKEVTIDEWKEKDLSTCIVSGDPECAFQKGTVRSNHKRGTNNVFFKKEKI